MEERRRTGDVDRTASQRGIFVLRNLWRKGIGMEMWTEQQPKGENLY